MTTEQRIRRKIPTLVILYELSPVCGPSSVGGWRMDKLKETQKVDPSQVL